MYAYICGTFPCVFMNKEYLIKMAIYIKNQKNIAKISAHKRRPIQAFHCRDEASQLELQSKTQRQLRTKLELIISFVCDR